jgi:hypothetical protein
MIIVGTHGFISCVGNQMFSTCSMTFKICRDNLIKRSYACKQIGGEYEKLNSFF